MLNFLDGSSPVPPFPPGYEPPGPVEAFVLWIVSYFILLGTLSLFLPRPWFCWLFRVAFPFMTERLEDGRKK